MVGSKVDLPQNLMPELLCVIFTFVIPRSYSITEPNGHQPREFIPRNAFVYSHVCQHWRRSSLADPVLWSLVFAHCALLRRIEIVKTILARCGDHVPLSLVLPPSPWTMLDSIEDPITKQHCYSDVLALILTQTHRFEWLAISDDTWDVTRFGTLDCNMQNNVTPALRRLDIWQETLPQDIVMKQMPDMIQLSPSTNVEELNMVTKGYFWSWANPIWWALKHLRVEYTYEYRRHDHCDQHTLLALLDALRHCGPHLETLSLNAIIPLHDSLTGDSDGVTKLTLVHLPRLRRLELTDVTSRIHDFLDCIQFPLTTDCVFVAHRYWQHKNWSLERDRRESLRCHIEATRGILHQFSARLGSVNITQIKRNDNHHRTMQCLISSIRREGSGIGTFSIQCTNDPSDKGCSGLVPNLAGALNETRVLDYSDIQPAARDVFLSCPNLEVLVVRSKASCDAFFRVNPYLHADEHQYKTHLNLRELAFVSKIPDLIMLKRHESEDVHLLLLKRLPNLLRQGNAHLHTLSMPAGSRKTQNTLHVWKDELRSYVDNIHLY